MCIRDRVYHNDAEVDACLDHLPDCGFNVLNWGKQKDIREVKQRVGNRMCLMGNVNPVSYTHLDVYKRQD